MVFRGNETSFCYRNEYHIFELKSARTTPATRDRAGQPHPVHQTPIALEHIGQSEEGPRAAAPRSPHAPQGPSPTCGASLIGEGKVPVAAPSPALAANVHSVHAGRVSGCLGCPGRAGRRSTFFEGVGLTPSGPGMITTQKQAWQASFGD